MGRVDSLDGSKLRIHAVLPGDDPPALGESICVNGCCLTMVTNSPLGFDLSKETTNRTTLGSLKPGDLLNLERAMRLTDRLGGHIVQGHVDAVGHVVRKTDLNGSTEFEFQAPLEFDRYLIDKGSIAIDGISLTVIEPQQGLFKVAVIPHTLEQTNLSTKQLGSLVNLEFDMIAKHLEKLKAPYLSTSART